MKKLFSVRIIILAGTLLLQLSTLCFQSRGAAGDVDLSFDPGSGINGTVNTVVVQPDGKVLIGGEFTTVKGLARINVARLNADGSGDNSFSPGTGANGSVSSVVVQSDGKVLVGHVDYGIARLHSDGSLDTSFNASTDSLIDQGYATVNSIAVQPDGKVLIAGDFYTLNGTNVSYGIARLNANGSLDTSFNVGAGINGLGYSLALQSDGKVLVGGAWTTGNGTNTGIARLNSNGSLDNSFNPGSGVGGYVYSVVVHSDGKVLIGGEFTTVNGTNRNRIARLNANGSLDSSFNPGTGVGGVGGYSYGVRSVVVQSDGKVLIGGGFNTVNGTNAGFGIARLNANGSLDSTFNPGTGANGSVASVALQSDGTVLIGGDFTAVNGTNRNRMARLNADGSLDGSFHPGTGLNSAFSSLAVQPDGKVLIGGAYTFINGTNRYGSGQLNADGSLDSAFISDRSFHPDLAFVIQNEDCRGGPDFECSQSWVATAVLVQADGKVLVGGYSATVDVDLFDNHPFNSYRSFLARVHADGSRDSSFEPAIGGIGDVPGGVSALAVQPDGRIVVGGTLFSIRGTNRYGIARLNADGSQDNSFNPGTGTFAGGVTSVALQADGKVLIGGPAVHATNGSYGIARLNANGSLDGSFNPGTGAFGDSVFSVALQPDGKVLIGGSFTSFSGTPRTRMARLNADGSMDSSFNPGTGADGAVRSIALQPDGNILIGGDFLTVNGVVRPYVARLHGNSTPPSFAAWALGHGLTGAAAASDADPDHDGLSNGVEYVLGGDPAAPASLALLRPTVAVSADNLLFTFPRADASETSDATLTVETGTDLVTWPATLTIGPNTAASSPGVSVTENGPDPDTVTVTIPSGTATRLFARLRVSVGP